MDVPDREHPVATGVVEEVASPSGFRGRRRLHLHELEARALRIEAVRGVEVTGCDGDVVEAHDGGVSRVRFPVVQPTRSTSRRSNPARCASSSAGTRTRERNGVRATRRHDRRDRRPRRAARGTHRAACAASTIAGISFFTNLESDKARDLAHRAYAAVVFHWREVERQVRVRGPVDGTRAGTRSPATGIPARAGTASPRGRRRRAPWSDRADARSSGRRGGSAFRGRRPAAARFLGRVRHRARRARVLAGPGVPAARPRAGTAAPPGDGGLGHRAARAVTPVAWVALAVARRCSPSPTGSSRARDDQRLEYVAKPATLVALIVVALALDPTDGAQRVVVRRRARLLARGRRVAHVARATVRRRARRVPRRARLLRRRDLARPPGARSRSVWPSSPSRWPSCRSPPGSCAPCVRRSDRRWPGRSSRTSR